MKFAIPFLSITGRASLEVEIADGTEERLRLRAAVTVAVSNKADLRGAYLRGAYLGGADLRGADLRGAYLRGADLGGADLGGADLGGADLRGADLGGADLRGADLRGAYLRGADLGGAYLRGADLRGAYLRGAYLGGAYLGGADLGGGVKIQSLIARLTRTIEEYEFSAFRTEDGNCVVVAGCHGPWTVDEYRKHVASNYPDSKKATETLAILEFIEARDKATREPATNPTGE